MSHPASRNRFGRAILPKYPLSPTILPANTRRKFFICACPKFAEGLLTFMILGIRARTLPAHVIALLRCPHCASAFVVVARALSHQH
jgi:hypothetical protein